jgi:hypothetical protein
MIVWFPPILRAAPILVSGHGYAARMMIKHVHSPRNLPKLSEKIFCEVDSRQGLGGPHVANILDGSRATAVPA